ncbi:MULTISPECIES: LeoA/HP0731 family dynamin-like GTPase [unclassified Moraxella]|uniref:LeoA/HP0731 family dynamin-like GTPase n=1 Tax=unclassified Moraxella TaxID=2685852 RepID=UPI002B407F0B|nr:MULTISPECIES: LeoA/HP0731 family dynamin-like GTPase [unclassified Moraxella]
MNDTIQLYHQRQQALGKLTEKLAKFIQKGQQFGLQPPNSLKEKIKASVDLKQNEKLKIALIGGFSEGKTSIAAAWLGKIDKSTMKISASESSNEVTIYEIDDDCVLIDTPGLYGYKEQKSSDNEVERYKDITKKYVSEAHIVLYVMNSSNPIKESHKEDLIWLFRELNLLSRTVFVLSRFDEVADVEDETDYQNSLKIKRDDVTKRLNDFLNLSIEEKNALHIVAVSANPFDEGVEYWLENLEEFRQLSHIDTLQQATKDIVVQNGGLDNVVVQTQKSIINDILLQEVPKIEEKNHELVKIGNELNDLYDLKYNELQLLSKKIQQARVNIKSSLRNLFDDIFIQADGVSIETAQNFYNLNFGKDGCLVQSAINQVLLNETASITNELNDQVIKFNADIDNIDSAVNKMAKQGLNHLVKNVKINNAHVLAVRDGIRSMASMAGLDFSKALKFKPYGAVKFAKNLNGAIAILGVAMEFYDSYKKQKAEEAFQLAMEALRDDLQSQQKDLLAFIDSNKFIPMFFDGFFDLDKAVNSLKQEQDNIVNQQANFNQWKQEGEIIEGEFREL